MTDPHCLLSIAQLLNLLLSHLALLSQQVDDILRAREGDHTPLLC